MTHTVWDPSLGHDIVNEQRPPAPAAVSSDGRVGSGLWAPSQGPNRTEVGGTGGEPDGLSVPIRKVCWE